MLEPDNTRAEKIVYQKKFTPLSGKDGMGNSLPHLLETDDLKQALQNFFATLKSGGTLILHLLNYCRILQRRERIIGVTRDTEGREFIRFYDFSEKSKIVFNLLTIDWRGNSSGQNPATSLRGVELYPYTEEELKSALAATGFSGIQSYGDLNFSPFEADSSGTLLLLAKR